MFFEKISFDVVSIYKTNVFDKVDISKLYDIGHELRHFLPIKNIDKEHAPGYQISIPSNHSASELLYYVSKLCVEHYSKVHNLNYTNWYSASWFYISESTLTDSNYHHHLFIGDSNSNTFNDVPTTFTAVLYLSLPELISDKEGAIRFKTETGKEYDIYPKLGDLIWFPPGLQHKPLLNPSSKTPRYTLGTNFYIHKKRGGGSLI